MPQNSELYYDSASFERFSILTDTALPSTFCLTIFIANLLAIIATKDDIAELTERVVAIETPFMSFSNNSLSCFRGVTSSPKGFTFHDDTKFVRLFESNKWLIFLGGLIACAFGLGVDPDNNRKVDLLLLFPLR